jgi:hypothetical protein
MKHYLFICLCCMSLALLTTCKKEPEEVIKPPITPDTPKVYVPIYHPGDTSSGAAYGLKLTSGWTASAQALVQTFFDTNYVAIIFLTYSSAGYIRETFGFSHIPKHDGVKKYGLKKMTGETLIEGFVTPSYGTWQSDGDVLEDRYQLDTTATDNQFEVTKMDLVNKRMECTFTVTFDIVEPRVRASNPKKVKFSNGRAWAVIED